MLAELVQPMLEFWQCKDNVTGCDWLVGDIYIKELSLEKLVLVPARKPVLDQSFSKHSEVLVGTDPVDRDYGRDEKANYRTPY